MTSTWIEEDDEERAIADARYFLVRDYLLAQTRRAVESTRYQIEKLDPKAFVVVNDWLDQIIDPLRPYAGAGETLASSPTQEMYNLLLHRIEAQERREPVFHAEMSYAGVKHLRKKMRLSPIHPWYQANMKTEKIGPDRWRVYCVPVGLD